MAAKIDVKCPNCERTEKLAKGEGFFCHGTIVWRDGGPPPSWFEEPKKPRKRK